jgi:hypothetical protein
MGWREKMGSETPTRNPINPKTLHGKEVSSVSRVNSKGSENEKPGYLIPTTENEFAMDERAAIQADGGQDEPGTGSGVSFPVAIVMDSAILGSTVDVMLWPDRAEVAGVQYSNAELVDLKSSGLPADDLRVVHRVKQTFDGVVIPSGTRW